MTWSSVFVSALLLAGCAEEVFDTQVVVFAESEACNLAIARGVQVNAYRVALLTLPDGFEDETRPPCVACAEDMTCTFRELSCRCGPRIEPRTLPINDQLEDLRFSALDPAEGYCLAIVAYDLPELARPEPEECPCGFMGVDAVGRSRLCGITPFAARVSENSSFVPIVADCPMGGCTAFEGP